jgi:glycosyltransferase involved in cell wall biosynthesis
VKVAAVFWGHEPAEGGKYAFGGSLLQALQEAEAGSRHEFVYYVAATATEPPSGVLRIPYTRRERYRRAAVYRLRDLLGLPRLHRGRFRTWLERSVAEQRVDVVWFASNYAEECDLPFVLTIFDIEHARQPWFPEVSAAGEWQRRHSYYSRYIPKATRVIVPNEAGRDQIVHHFQANPERVLCLGHPTPSFAREAAQRERLPRGRVERLGIGGRYLFYPAQFWAHKNHSTLFDALAELGRDGGEPFELALVGSDMGQLEHVRRLAQASGVAERVHFLGFVDMNDLVALYQHAHALTYLSFFGPENLPPLEAFALGCPVVAADVPGAREQLGDAAILVPPTEPALVAAAVRQLEDPALREQLVERGMGRAEDQSAERYVQGLLAFFDEFEQVRKCWA